MRMNTVDCIDPRGLRDDMIVVLVYSLVLYSSITIRYHTSAIRNSKLPGIRVEYCTNIYLVLRRKYSWPSIDGLEGL